MRRFHSTFGRVREVVEEGADLGPRPRLGLGRELDAGGAADARQRQPGDLGPPRLAAAEQQPRGGRPLQVEVGVVLPREADAAEHLDAVLGRAVGRVGARWRPRPRWPASPARLR